VRMLKCRYDVPGYHQFVRSKLQSFNLEGWGGFVLKEKLKWIKSALKDWHLTHSHDLPCKIHSLKNKMGILEARGEENVLSEEDVSELHDISAELHSLSMANVSILWQQSRLLWLGKETQILDTFMLSCRVDDAVMPFHLL
jgi:hypothetical protein